MTFPFLHAPNSKYACHDQLNRIWKDLNAPHLDLVPIFERFSSSTVDVGLCDVHSNEYPHELAATAILEFQDMQLATKDVKRLTERTDNQHVAGRWRLRSKTW